MLGLAGETALDDDDCVMTKLVALLALFAFALGLAGCGDEQSDAERAAAAFDAAIEKFPAGVSENEVRLADVTDFSWSAARFTGPESPYEFTLEFQGADGDGSARFESANAECVTGLGWLAPAEARFRVLVHKYPDGSLYRLLIPATRSRSEIRKCIRDHGPEDPGAG